MTSIETLEKYAGTWNEPAAAAMVLERAKGHLLDHPATPTCDARQQAISFAQYRQEAIA